MSPACPRRRYIPSTKWERGCSFGVNNVCVCVCVCPEAVKCWSLYSAPKANGIDVHSAVPDDLGQVNPSVPQFLHLYKKDSHCTYVLRLL